MLRADEVCKKWYIFSDPSIQPVYDCFVITGMTNSCYGPLSVFTFINILYASRVRAHVEADRITVARKHLFGSREGECLV